MLSAGTVNNTLSHAKTLRVPMLSSDKKMESKIEKSPLELVNGLLIYIGEVFYQGNGLRLRFLQQ